MTHGEVIDQLLNKIKSDKDDEFKNLLMLLGLTFALPVIIEQGDTLISTDEMFLHKNLLEIKSKRQFLSSEECETLQKAYESFMGGKYIHWSDVFEHLVMFDHDDPDPVSPSKKAKIEKSESSPDEKSDDWIP